MNSGAPASNQVVRSYMTLRKAIGWIGVLLPFAVFLGNWVFFSHRVAGCLWPVSDKLPDSLSGYYYSHMRDVFVGGMWATGVFLLFYRGHDWIERWSTNIAGVFALGIALFPTRSPVVPEPNRCDPVTLLVVQPAPHATGISYVHLVSLCGLMVMVAVMAWRFSRPYSEAQKGAMTDDDRENEDTPRLKRRNKRIYLGCVIAIIVAGVFALVQNFFSTAVKHDAPWLLYAETVAFLAFGIAWFVKGRALKGLRIAGSTVRDAPKRFMAQVAARRAERATVGSPTG